MGDEQGGVTTDPKEARFFDFDFVVEGENLGRVSISINERGTLKVFYSQGILEDSNDFVHELWYDFLREMRMFAKRRLLRFDTRDITKSNLNKNDFQYLAANGPKDQNMNMSESAKFEGSKKTSYRVLEKTKLIARHKESIENETAGARSRKNNIKALYIENSEGERFKYPFIHIAGAKAMQRHVANGGKPYDDIGNNIIEMSEEIMQLTSFKRHIGKPDGMNERVNEIAAKTNGKLEMLRRTVEGMCNQTYYEKWSESFVPNKGDMQMDQATMEDYKNAFTVSSFREDLAQYFPLIHKIMHEAGEVDLEEFVGEGKDSTCEGCGMAESKCECPTEEGIAGGAVGGAIGAFATKSPRGALAGAELGSDAEDAIKGAMGEGGMDPAAEQDYAQWEQALRPHGDGAYAFDLVRGDETTIKNILAYVKQNRAVLGKEVSDETGRTVKDAIIDIRNKFPQLYQAAQQPQGVVAQPKPRSAAESIEDFVEWADRVEEGRLEPDTLAQLKELIDGGLTLDEAGRSAIDALQGIGIFDDELEAALEELSKVNTDADPKDTILAWLDKDDPEAAKEFGYKGTAQPADAGEKMPTENTGGMTPSVRDVAEMVYSMYNKNHKKQGLGPWPRGEEGVITHVTKELGEEAGQMAEQLVKELSTSVHEGPDMDQIPAYVRKQKQQSQQTAQAATDKRNEKAGAKVWSSPRTNEDDSAEQMTPNWAKYVLDQLYNSDGEVTLTDLFDEGIPGLHAMFMDTAQKHGLNTDDEFEDVQHELTLELEDLIKGGHESDDEKLPEDSTFEAIMRLVNYKK